jgi:hypothetical protein
VDDLFLIALLSWEHGQDDRALDATLTLLESAARQPDEEWPALLAAAAVARLPALLESSRDPRPWEDRLLALTAPAAGVRSLAWQVTLGVEDALDGIARRRGDAALLAELPARTGCLTAAQLVGSVGRCPTWIFGVTAGIMNVGPSKGPTPPAMGSGGEAACARRACRPTGHRGMTGRSRSPAVACWCRPARGSPACACCRRRCPRASASAGWSSTMSVPPWCGWMVVPGGPTPRARASGPGRWRPGQDR